MDTVRAGKTDFYADPAREPTIPPPVWEAIPDALRMAVRWVLWRLIWKDNADGTGKWDKVPFQITGKAAKPNDAGTWTAFEKVKAKYHPAKFAGIGFMLGGGFAGLDLDNAIDPTTGELFPWADRIVRRFATYTELSPSGTGVKLFGHGLWTGDRHRWKHETGEVEVYSAARYFTVTGARVGDVTTAADIQAALDELAGESRKPDDVPPPPRSPSAGGAALPDDEELIRKAKAAKNGEKFRRLWAGDTSDHGKDDSAADLALCSLLAFWTGPDPARIDSLFRQSGLMRKKWDEKRGATTYGERTIRTALEGRTEFHDPNRTSTTNTNDAPPNSAGWPDPIPLIPAFDPPAFPVAVLSPWMREYAIALAEEKQVPADLAAMLILGAAAAGLARKVTVSPRPGWNAEPINLYVMCCLPPGERKSQTFGAVFAPVKVIEAELRKEAEPRVKEAESELRVKQKRVDHLEAKIAKEEDACERARMQEALKVAREELLTVAVPAMPILRVDDDTPEMLALELVKQHGRLLAASPEARTLENIDRYSDKPNMDVFLKAHAGDDLRSGRIGRGRDSVDRPALTCAYSPQPCVLEGLGATPELRGRGFLARWFFSLPASAVGYRKVRSDPIPEAVRLGYESALLQLWLVEYLDAEAETPHDLELTADAQAELEAFEAWREPHLRAGGELATCGGWANKLNGLCVRLCGILHVADGITSRDAWMGMLISAGVVRRAVTLCREYAIPHALAAFGLMGESEAVARARKLLRWLGDRRPNPTAEFSKRDAFNGCRGTFETVDEIEPALELLERHALIRPKPDPLHRPGPGRKASPVFEVNPRAFDPAAHNPHFAHNSSRT